MANICEFSLKSLTTIDEGILQLKGNEGFTGRWHENMMYVPRQFALINFHRGENDQDIYHYIMVCLYARQSGMLPK